MPSILLYSSGDYTGLWQKDLCFDKCPSLSNEAYELQEWALMPQGSLPLLAEQVRKYFQPNLVSQGLYSGPGTLLCIHFVFNSLSSSRKGFLPFGNSCLGKSQTNYFPDWYLWLRRQQRAWGWRWSWEQLIPSHIPWASSDSFTILGQMAIL